MMDILSKAYENAKANVKRIIFPESDEERTLRAIEIMSNERLIIPVLLGKKDDIYVRFKELSLRPNYNTIEIIDPETYDANELAEKLYEIRKDKGMSLNEARRLVIEEPIYFATMLVKMNMVHGLVSGAVHSTGHTIKPALQIIKTKHGISRVSSYFIIIEGERVFFFADCAINIDPNDKELAEIAALTAKSAKNLGFEPRVAMLSFSTKGSAKHALVDKVVSATTIAKTMMPDAIIDGEMQLDAAIAPEVAKIKAPDSVIKGDANVLIFPNLEAGNIGYKIAQRFGRARAIGPVLQGLAMPVNDLSRGCSVQDIIDLAVLTSNE